MKFFSRSRVLNVLLTRLDERGEPSGIASREIGRCRETSRLLAKLAAEGEDGRLRKNRALRAGGGVTAFLAPPERGKAARGRRLEWVEQ